MIIDAHTHIAVLPGLPKIDGGFKKVRDQLLREMRQSKVDYAVVIPSHLKQGGFAQSLEPLLKLVAGEKRFIPVGTIDVEKYTKNDLVRLRELLSKNILRGIKLYTGYQHFYPSDKRCKSIYELCTKYDVPVIYHSGDTFATDNEVPKVKYSHPLHIDEVASDNPDLKIIIAHLGNPWLIDCAEVLWKNKNVYADISGLVVGDKLNSPYGKLMRGRIEELIIYSSPRKLFYGTDWPLAKMKDYIVFTKKLGVKGTDLDYIFYKNAADLFKIKIK